MRAQVFHGPGDLRFEDLPVPEPGGLVMRVDAALTCGTDVKTLRRGHPVMIPHVPTVFGHELAGVVTAVGRGAPGVKEGDRVVAANSAPCGWCRLCAAGRPNLCEDLLFVNGAYGQYIALPPRLVARNLVRLGAGVPAARAAFAEPLACALLGVERAREESGQTVMVIGHGPLGCLLGMVAVARKARVILVGKAGWRFDRVQALGIAECVDATAAGDVVAAVRGLTDGRGVDVAIEVIGLRQTMEQAVRCLAVLGRAALAGISDRPFEIDSYRDLLGREAEVIGCSDHTLRELEILTEYVRQGRLDLGHVVARSVPLEAEAINAAMDALEQFGGEVRTVVVP